MIIILSPGQNNYDNKDLKLDCPVNHSEMMKMPAESHVVKADDEALPGLWRLLIPRSG